MPKNKMKITLNKAIKEYSKVRTCIADYFAQVYPDVIKKEVYDKAKNRAEMQKGNLSIDIEDITQEIPLLYNDFLCKGKLPDTETYSPLSVYIFDRIEQDFLLEDMIEIRKMNLLGYIGLFKTIKRQNDSVLLVKNIISGEEMEITSSNVLFTDTDNENILGNIFLQYIQPWKGYNFCCGNGLIVPRSILLGIMKLYVKQLRDLHYCYYSSKKNLEKTYDILDEQKIIFFELFRKNPITFMDYNEFKEAMSEYFYKCRIVIDKKAGLNLIENNPKNNEFKSWKFGINVHIGHEGLFIFSDHLQCKKYIQEYTKTKEKKLKKELLYFFTGYIEGFKHIPCEVLLGYEEEFPKEINRILKNVNKYYPIDFPDWKTLIRFWHPDYPEYMPTTIFLEPRLTQFLSGDLKFGRNSPCICGSGKKFKVCCGQR